MTRTNRPDTRGWSREQRTRSVSGHVQKARRSSLGRQVRIISWRTLNAKLSSDCFQREIENDSMQEKNLNVW